MLTPQNSDPDPGSDDTDLLPLKAAAEFLRLSPSTLLRMHADGRIRATRTPGGHRRFERAELDRVRQELAS